MYLSDIHTHSIASGHGTTCTISDMAKAASQKGLKLLGITDHGPATLAAGIQAETKQEETDREIVLTIRLPKRAG